jgi:hypothetical protein
MQRIRYIGSRLPWVLLGVGIGATAVWLAVGRPEPAKVGPEVGAPVAVNPDASADPDPARERRVGAALARVRPGMTRREVEELLGVPDLARPQQFTVRWRAGPDGRQAQIEVPYVVYYCSPPHLPPGPHLMTVEYDAELFAPIPPEAKVIDVSGPHTPAGCG